MATGANCLYFAFERASRLVGLVFCLPLVSAKRAVDTLAFVCEIVPLCEQ